MKTAKILRMNSKSVYIIYVILFLFMICDLIIGFPLIVKAIFYIPSFVIGAIIYYFNFYKPKSESHDKN